MLLDPDSLDLVQHIDTVLDAIEGDELAERINAELMQSVVEIATPVCRNAGDVMRELTTLRGYVRDVARAHGLRFGSAGTHPFSFFERQRITAKDRYRALIDQLQYVARRELIFGMHIHVAVDDPDKAIQVVNGLLLHLRAAARPLGELAVLARRAHRPRVEPADRVFRVPALGPSAPLRGLRRLCRRGRAARANGLHRRLHAHLVGHPPPPEVGHGRDQGLRRGHAGRGRGCDRGVLPGAREAPLASATTASEPIPTHHRILTSENKWLAARYGLEAPLMDLATGRRIRVPLAKLVRRTLRELEPHARELGSERELEGIAAILGRGNWRRGPAPGLQRQPRRGRGRPRHRGRDGDRGRRRAHRLAAQRSLRCRPGTARGSLRSRSRSTRPAPSGRPGRRSATSTATTSPVRRRVTGRQPRATTCSSPGDSGSSATSSSGERHRSATRTRSGPRRRPRRTSRAGCSASRTGRCARCSESSGPTTWSSCSRSCSRAVSRAGGSARWSSLGRRRSWAESCSA